MRTNVRKAARRDRRPAGHGPVAARAHPGAAGRRARHGAQRQLRRGPARLRLRLLLLRPPGRLRHRRPGRHGHPAADRLSPVPALGPRRGRRQRGPHAGGAGPAHRRGPEPDPRRQPLARPRPARHVPARRARQADPHPVRRPLGGPPAGAPAQLRRRVPALRDHGRRRARDHDAAARPGHRRRVRGDPARDLLRGRRAQVPRGPADGRPGGRVRALRRAGELPPAPPDRVPGPVQGPAGRQLPDRAGPDRPGLGRPGRRRPRPLRAQVRLAARGPHRLHLRGHRRGDRPGRDDAGAGRVRRAHRARLPGRDARARPLRCHAGHGHHDVDRLPGLREHGHRDLYAARHRRPAAVRQLRRLRAGDHPGGDGRAAQRGRAGTGRDEFEEDGCDC